MLLMLRDPAFAPFLLGQRKRYTATLDSCYTEAWAYLDISWFITETSSLPVSTLHSGYAVF